ncbi:MAG: tryptophan synthase subunit beta [Coriobacteriia bacterium]|nr:tryptophan synthase subunit beta [Coriobacteriia bacterium]
MDFVNHEKLMPDKNGYYGNYGGAYIPDKLKPAFAEITEAYQKIAHSAEFISELRRIRREFQGRPTPLTHCKNLSNKFGSCQIYLKREDLNHTGAHKLNHCMGEALLAKYMGKKKIIAETGAGSHGVALATAAAFFGLECDVYMGEVDIEKQHPNVIRMEMLGTKVIPVTHGQKTLKEAVDAAFDAYSKEYKDCIYCIGSVVGPHPFPLIVRDFQAVVGAEALEQFKSTTGLLPDTVCACIGGGSNSIGMFIPFLDQPVNIVGVEPMGRGKAVGDNAASMEFGSEGILHGFKSIVQIDDKGEAQPVYSIAPGLDYPGVGPEHAYLRDKGRVTYDYVTDEEAMTAFFLLSKLEGIIPAVESAHAVAYAIKYAKQEKTGSILVNLSGRGDKDIDFVNREYGNGDKLLEKNVL